MRLHPINSNVQIKDGPSTNEDVICGPKVNSIGCETGYQASGRVRGPEVNSTGQSEYGPLTNGDVIRVFEVQ